VLVPHKPGKRPRARAPAAAPTDRGLHGGITNPCDLLPQHDVEQLIEGAFALLRDTGCAFETGSEATELFKAAGCSVGEDGVVRFEPELVREAIATTAKNATLWDRTGMHGIELDMAHTWFMPGMTGIKVYDLATGVARDSTGADLATITRVADALPWAAHSAEHGPQARPRTH